MISIESFPWNAAAVDNGPDARFPLNETTVGLIITDPDHIKRIAENHTSFLSGSKTPYLTPEDGFCFKKHDDYFTEIAVIGEDSMPVLASSYSILIEGSAYRNMIAALSFIARFVQTNSVTFGAEATPELLIEAQNLYAAFLNNGGNETTDVRLVNSVYRFAKTTLQNPTEFFKRYEATDNSERLRRAGKKTGNPTAEDRAFTLAVVTEVLNAQ